MNLCHNPNCYKYSATKVVLNAAIILETPDEAAYHDGKKVMPKLLSLKKLSRFAINHQLQR